jgi:intein/homing endonuclease
MNVKKNKLELKNIKDIWFSGYKQIYRITTSSGKFLDATSNHPILLSNMKCH